MTKTTPTSTRHPREVLQRILFPREGEPTDVRRLYWEDHNPNAGRLSERGRHSANVPAGVELSAATYFNAFPAGYWHRWSSIDAVTLSLQVEGRVRIDLYRSKADGTRIHLTGTTANSGRVDLDAELTAFEDGGWLWFDLIALDELTIVEGAWVTNAQSEIAPTLAIGMPSFNQSAHCVRALAALAEDETVLSKIESVIVADQGDRKAYDEPDFEQVRQALGGRLVVWDQPNLGGSGGYARVMYEALGATEAQFILFMDDDISIEPDSILRALAFARFARVPTLVGAQMLDLQRRARLHTMGEVLDFQTFMWNAAPHTSYDTDLSVSSLADLESMHRRVDVDFNGWWMCLIPRSVAETIGYPLPLFIKWDDAEYSLRARAAGFPTVTLPGAAIWHMAWTGKDDATDWQAYFHLRNRLIVAAIHGDRETISGVLKHSLMSTAKHLLCMEYSTVAIQVKAVQDFLLGPEHIQNILATALSEVNSLRAQYSDSRIMHCAHHQLQAPTRTELGTGGHAITALLPVLANQFSRSSKTGRSEKPAEVMLTRKQGNWKVLGRLRKATVTTADDSGITVRERDNTIARTLLRESLQTRLTVLRRYPDLSAQYRNSARYMTSRAYWTSVFTAGSRV